MIPVFKNATDHTLYKVVTKVMAAPHHGSVDKAVTATGLFSEYRPVSWWYGVIQRLQMAV